MILEFAAGSHCSSHFEKRDEAGESTKKVGVLFKDLTVKGVEMSSVSAKTLPQAIMGTFGPDLYRLTTRFIPILNFNRAPPLRILTNDFTGVAKPGEMVLVLGRPGAGCSTFLKAIANKRDGFAAVTGDVSYGGISAEEQRKRYRGEVGLCNKLLVIPLTPFRSTTMPRTISIFRH